MISSRKKIAIFLMLFFCLALPLASDWWFTANRWYYTNEPLHVLIEAAGAIMALVLASLIYINNRYRLVLNRYNYVAAALIVMGLLGLSHAMMSPGNLFVWIHSLAVMFGGLLFMGVWLSQQKVSLSRYRGFFNKALAFGIALIVVSVLAAESIPSMIRDGHFTQLALLMNLIGALGFFVAAAHFVKRFLVLGSVTELLFAGHTILFGVTGLLFISSSLWEANWWFWHVLRLFAYSIGLYYAIRLFSLQTTHLKQNEDALETEKRKLQNHVEQAEQYQHALEVGSILSKTDSKGRITYANDLFCNMTGYQPEELLGKTHSMLRHPDTSRDIYRQLWQTIRSGQVWKGSLKNLRKDGSIMYMKMTIVPILDKLGKIQEFLAFRDDVSALVESRETLKHFLYHDQVTDLFNREKIQRDIKELEKPVLVLLDIDRFSHVNEFFGYQIGNGALLAFSQECQKLADKLGMELYRIHGDEFALLGSLDHISMEKLRHFLTNWLNHLDKQSFLVEKQEVHLSASCGIANGNQHDILIEAAMAVKQARELKVPMLEFDNFFADHSLPDYQDNILWTYRIKKAREQKRFTPYFQGIYELATGKLHKIEVLMRMEEDGHVYSPAPIIDIAKRTRQYSEITRIMLEKTLDVMQSHPELKFSFNISPEDISNTDTLDFIKQKIEAANVEDRLTLEILETENIEDHGLFNEFILWAKSRQIGIAIDDFGVGYSNFVYLMELQADTVKVDGSITKALISPDVAEPVFDSIMSFTNRKDMKVIAEFVESGHVCEKLIELGIKYGQGYLLHKPSPDIPPLILSDKLPSMSQI